MNRKGFLRNAMMALAVSLVPEILRPSVARLEGDKLQIVRWVSNWNNKPVWQRVAYVKPEEVEDCFLEMRIEGDRFIRDNYENKINHK